MKQLRIVIADDSDDIRNAIVEALSKVNGLMIVGEAADGAQAFWLYNRTSPNLLILDLGMPKASGFEVLQTIREKDNATIIIIFTADPGLSLRDACINAGANFYLDKSELSALINICQHLQQEEQCCSTVNCA
jgi:DNA-binding NarL/FixJ family response regulator